MVPFVIATVLALAGMEKGATPVLASKHSIADHLEFCERKVRRTAFHYPWQIGFLGTNAASSNLFPNIGRIGMTPLVRPPQEERVAQAPKNLFETHCSPLLCKQPLISWDSNLNHIESLQF